MSTAVSDDDVRPQAPGASDDDEPEAAEEAPAVSPYRRVGLDPCGRCCRLASASGLKPLQQALRH